MEKILGSIWLSRAMGKPYMESPYSFRFEFIILGLMALVISEVFRIGVKMREEQALTI